MDLYDIAIARKLSGGGGGGGSSDFSTATVTVVNGNINANIPYLMNMGGLEGIFVMEQGYPEGTHEIALWHGAAIVYLRGSNQIVSGNVKDMGEGMYLVTGDFSVSIPID